MIYSVCILIEIVVIIACLHSFYDSKLVFNIKKVCVICGDVILMQLIKAEIIPAWMNLLIYPILILYCTWEFGFCIKKIIVNLCLTLVLLSGIQIVAAMLISELIGIEDEGIRTICIHVSMMVIYWIISHKFNIKKLSECFQRWESALIAILLGGVVIIVICLFKVKFFKILYFEEIVPLVVLVAVICVMAVSWEKYKIKAIESEAELQAYKLYENSYQNLIMEIRLKQHDFNNHIAAIYNQHKLFYSYDELVAHQKQYCEELKDDNKYSKLLKADNSMVIGFLYSKFLEAEKRGIDVQYEVQIMSLAVDVPSYKLVAMLGNLLNNAFEALDHVNDLPKKLKVHE